MTHEEHFEFLQRQFKVKRNRRKPVAKEPEGKLDIQKRWNHGGIHYKERYNMCNKKRQSRTTKIQIQSTAGS